MVINYLSGQPSIMLWTGKTNCTSILQNQGYYPMENSNSFGFNWNGSDLITVSWGGLHSMSALVFI